MGRFGGSVPSTEETSARISQTHWLPPSVRRPGGNGPGSRSWSEKLCSEPSQKQTCIKHPTDTLTNKSRLKIPTAKSQVWQMLAHIKVLFRGEKNR